MKAREILPHRRRVLQGLAFGAAAFTTPGLFADLVATLAHFTVTEKDEVLQRLDVGARLVQSRANISLGASSTWGWGGMAGTHSWMAPRVDLCGVCMTQRMPGFWHPFSHDFKRMVYEKLG